MDMSTDFHRLDRTSLRLAHSFNHLVGEREQFRWHFQAEGLLEIDGQFELRWLLNGKISRLGSLEDAMSAGTSRRDQVRIRRK